MKKLSRSGRPDVLGRFSYRIHTWDKDVTKAHKKKIWEKIDLMQFGTCCYCESKAVRGNGHIEHFFHKGEKNGIAHYKYMTFDWTNLFGCCGLTNAPHCGHYKDREGESGPGDYDPNDLIKPDTEDPLKYLQFDKSGAVNKREGLCAGDAKKADETIRVLNLNCGTLKQARRKKIAIYSKELEVILQLSDESLRNIKRQQLKQSIFGKEFQASIIDANMI
ncbi:retron Ec78 anti-phage system effector HNH endonuclease PtuB [Bacterioplanoides sp. SCSIO 12839]|uniref:retron Ec78 anti-phage system effector HNH endonuclease PtuB n=1 Tax=Bacterioplanoides sp. SCSIO 12839 TaxID=2829569 RepID=UPI0021069D59|nr:retron Ec78 anti-phage system effector HNH endonuclease PtuB [Bacterioplanoides sp. SCSIO 12839]UTW49168.1 TIGR02646 family protein [Bacterioplanoides sp. SCSIO 12839]